MIRTATDLQVGWTPSPATIEPRVYIASPSVRPSDRPPLGESGQKRTKTVLFEQTTGKAAEAEADTKRKRLFT
jgi:hypothetical protein